MSIADRMSGMSGRGGGISERMEKPKPMEHEHGGVPEHLKALHEEMGGKHFHGHVHESGVTTHHIKEDGKVEGPHEHESMDEASDHLKQVMNEEEHEPEHHGHDDGLM